MPSAEVRSRVRSEAEARMRAEAHRALDEMLDTMISECDAPVLPTLRTLSRKMCEERTKLTTRCMREIVEYILENYTDVSRTPCPSCHKTLFRKRREPKQLSTLVGPFVVKRPYFYCTRCAQGYYPLDEALELASEVHQYDVQEKVARYAAKVPYGEVTKMVEDLTGVKVQEHCSHETLNRLKEATTVENVLPSREEIERRIDAARADSPRRPVLVVATDGAHTPTRPPGGRKTKRGKGYWREVKGVRLYLTDRKGRITPLLSWHQICEGEEIRPVLELAAARIPMDKVRIALVGDGAPWLWKAMESAFPDAVQVLDYYHCAQHLWKVANLQFPDVPEDAQHWVEAMLTRLCVDQGPQVIGDLYDLLPRTYEVGREIEKLANYLGEHIHRLNYDARKQQGFPIGSGGIESNNKYIVHTRMKRTGAWWLEPNSNTMLRVRCAIYNETFDQVFNSYVASKRKPLRS